MGIAPKKSKSPIRELVKEMANMETNEEAYFPLPEIAENMPDAQSRVKTHLFQSLLVSYAIDSSKPDKEMILGLADELGLNRFRDFSHVKDKKYKSFYEWLLNGPKDEKHYFGLASEIYEGGFTAEAIAYLKKGISLLPKDQSRMLVRTRDEFEIAKIYIGATDYLSEQISKAASCDVDILIEGETGTGKELVAHLIHDLSNRKNKTFLPISCAEIAPSLIESELFGYRKGSFTGASQNMKGIFESANNGTVFLDELNELENFQQAKLLRFLQEREIRPIGSTKPTKLDIRVLCATSKTSSEMLRTGKMRPDLFYRIKAFTISLPPLRRRKEIIPGLALHFAEKHGQDRSKKSVLSNETLKLFENYSWPGNFREIENLIRVLVNTIYEEKITPAHIANYFKDPSDPSCLLSQAAAEKWSEDKLISTYHDIVLSEVDGNVVKASKILGIYPSTLRRRKKANRSNIHS